MIAFSVLGTPAPQGSKTAVMRGGRPILIEGASTVGREAHRNWREAVAWEANAAALEHGPIGDEVPVAVAVWFFLPKPKSRPRKAVWADRKPDLDKLIRATLDGLADGGLLRHDSRVVRIAAAKAYAVGPSGAAIAISTDPYRTPVAPISTLDTFRSGVHG